MLRTGLECITTKTLFVLTVSIQIDTDILSLDAVASVKEMSGVIFDSKSSSIDKSLYESRQAVR
jgi:hypothetical protein